MRVLAIDPGTEQGAFVLFGDGAPIAHGIVQNAELLDIVSNSEADFLAIEWVSFYGKEIHAGSETFETCRWAGRFQQAWNEDATCVLIPRRQIRQELCGTQKAGDPEVRAVLIDRYGGKERAIGKKATPGPLYGISSHAWSALAVAAVFTDRFEQKKTA